MSKSLNKPKLTVLIDWCMLLNDPNINSFSYKGLRCLMKHFTDVANRIQIHELGCVLNFDVRFLAVIVSF